MRLQLNAPVDLDGDWAGLLKVVPVDWFWV